ncbi:EamA family transporter [Aquicoccus sp. SCR17]|nr:EamA family transporter [Carideicomes alvinocaridis]
MAVTGVLFVAVTALVKTLGTRLPAVEASFLRYAIGTILLLPIVPRLLRLRPSRRLAGLFLMRGAIHAVGVGLWFFAMARIPLADVTAMNYLSPIVVTVGAALFLGEKLAIRRMMAIVVALLGAFIILRPGFREIGPGHIAMLATATAFGASYLTAKHLTDESGPEVVVLLLSALVTLFLAPVAAANWVTPSLHELGLLLLVALCATAAHYAMSLAFAAAPVTVTQPVTFLQLVWAVLLGWLVFDEGVDPFVVLGGAVIIAAVSFITWRESVLKRRAYTPPSPATKT